MTLKILLILAIVAIVVLLVIVFSLVRYSKIEYDMADDLLQQRITNDNQTAYFIQFLLENVDKKIVVLCMTNAIKKTINFYSNKFNVVMKEEADIEKISEDIINNASKWNGRTYEDYVQMISGGGNDAGN